MRFLFQALTDRGQCLWAGIERIEWLPRIVRLHATPMPITRTEIYVRMAVFDETGREIDGGLLGNSVHVMNGDSVSLRWDIPME